MGNDKNLERHSRLRLYPWMILGAGLLLAVLAVIHFRTRPQVPEACIRIENGEENCLLRVADLETELVRGTVINGKGQQKEIEAQGLPLRDVLRQAGIEEFSEADVTAADAYHAVVTAEEAAMEGKVCLLLEDGAVRLRVFGDPDSKRNVADVVRIVIKGN